MVFPPAVPEEVERSVVGVVGDSGAGSGSVVAPERVLANRHAVAGQRTLAEVSAHTGGERRARLVRSFEALDVAVLAVDDLTLPPVVLGTMGLHPPEAGAGVGKSRRCRSDQRGARGDVGRGRGQPPAQGPLGEGQRAGSGDHSAQRGHQPGQQRRASGQRLRRPVGAGHVHGTARDRGPVRDAETGEIPGKEPPRGRRRWTER